jgi:hypothetical protein
LRTQIAKIKWGRVREEDEDEEEERRGGIRAHGNHVHAFTCTLT